MSCDLNNLPEREPRFKALIPFFVFAVFYLGLSIWAKDFYKIPMPVAFLIASATALLLNRKQPLGLKVDVFARGMGEHNIMLMCLIFILAGAFATVAKGMGAVDSAVLITQKLIPPSFLVPGIFIVSCIISLSIGTSCGTIAALTPIAAGLVGPMGVSPELLIGAVVGGAMFGDNMSMISDTTIAATRTQNVGMRDKFIANIRMVIPAAIITIVVYFLITMACKQNAVEPFGTVTWKSILAVTPYLLILVLALIGFNVMLLLFFGTVLACAIGMLIGKIDFWGALKLCQDGTLGMAETMIVAILAGGLLHVIKWNGGISYLIQVIEKHVHTKRGCEFGVAALVALVNLFTANNTVAIVIAGPIAKELSDKFHCDGKRISSILDTMSCVVQGMIPYGAQILIAVGVAKTASVIISPLALIGKLYYPWAMAIFLILSIALAGRRSGKQN